MIKTFKHKELKELFEKGSSRNIKQQDQSRCLRRLDALEAAEEPEEMEYAWFQVPRPAHQAKAVQRMGNWKLQNYL